MLSRVFPRQADNRFDGHRSALWLLWFLVALMLIVGTRSIVSTESVAVGADGIPIHSFGPTGARTVLMLFALDSVGTLTVAFLCVAILVRWRSLVPFLYLLLLGGQIVRRVVIQSYAIPRAEGSIAGWWLVAFILGLLSLGLLLSLIGRRPAGPHDSSDMPAGECA
jgi:hypothetical protein